MLQYNRHVSRALNFDPYKDLEPVTRLFFLHAVLRGDASLGVKTLEELAAYAKAHPKTLNYPRRPSLHQGRFIEELQEETGVDIVRVPFKRRRRGGQQHADRHDAGRDLRHRQFHRAICRPARSAASRSTAASVRRCSPTSRPCKELRPNVRSDPGRSSACGRRRARRQPIIRQDPRRRRRDRQRSGLRAEEPHPARARSGVRHARPVRPVSRSSRAPRPNAPPRRPTCSRSELICSILKIENGPCMKMPASAALDRAWASPPRRRPPRRTGRRGR